MTRGKKQLQLEQIPTPSNFSTLLSNEEETVLAHMVRNIVKEELQAHEVVLQEIVSSNLKITNERSEKFSGEVSDIKESLEFTQKQLEDKTKVIKKDIEILQKNLNKIEKDLLDPEGITNKLIKLEDRSRRNNLCIAQSNNNSWENCEEQFQKIIEEKLNIVKNIEIDRCHRAGKKQNNCPRTIFCRITKFKDKQLIQIS